MKVSKHKAYMERIIFRPTLLPPGYPIMQELLEYTLGCYNCSLRVSRASVILKVLTANPTSIWFSSHGARLLRPNSRKGCIV